MKYRRLEVESRYQALQTVGQPVDYKGGGYADFDLRPFLDDVLPQLPMPADGAWAFEYGTGTGPGACYLAERGFRVDAIDTSPTAIEMARRFAAERGLDIAFEVGDIARLHPWNRTYDLVVDNFCLHNLIADDERRQALRQVRALLRPGAHLVIGTSVFDRGRRYGASIRDETTGVVYSPLVAAGSFEDMTLIGDRPYFASVRHRTPEELRQELEAAGLCVVRQRRGRIVCTRAASAEGRSDR